MGGRDTFLSGYLANEKGKQNAKHFVSMNVATIGIDNKELNLPDSISLDYRTVSTKDLENKDLIIVYLPSIEEKYLSHICCMVGFFAGNQGKEVRIIDPENSCPYEIIGVQFYKSIEEYNDKYSKPLPLKNISSEGRNVIAEKYCKYLAYALLDVLDVKDIKAEGKMEVPISYLAVEEMSQLFGFSIEEKDDGDMLLTYTWINKKILPSAKSGKAKYVN